MSKLYYTFQHIIDNVYNEFSEETKMVDGDIFNKCSNDTLTDESGYWFLDNDEIYYHPKY